MPVQLPGCIKIFSVLILNLRILFPIKQLRQTFPFIPFLSPHRFPGIVTLVIRGAAVLPVVHMIRDQVGIHTIILQDLGHGIVERFHRPPASVQKIITSRVQFSPSRHAGQASRIALVKSDAAPRQSLKIRRPYPAAPIGLQHLTIE